MAAIEGDDDFPPLSHALCEPNGLLAIGGDLSSARLLNAYRQGIFPWFNAGDPIMWYSPNPRMVLFPNELKISKSLAKLLKNKLKNNTFEIRINTAFKAVITGCSTSLRGGQTGTENNTQNNTQNNTWISPDMIAAYCDLHAQGYAISAETWHNGELVGGCYGVKIGRMFYGESMFYSQPNASKIAFVHLVEWLKNEQVGLIDCQMKTPLLTSFGGREIAREEFSQMLTKLVNY